MNTYPRPYNQIEGKTYSLFGGTSSTSKYYREIGKLADCLLERCDDIDFILQTIQFYSNKKRLIDKISAKKEDPSLISFILHLLNADLTAFTRKADEHVRSLPLSKRFDRTLGTTRNQYHLYMLEIELVNRLNIHDFKKTDKKIALLPHCLRDLNADCKSSPDQFDYLCRSCSRNCYQNHISRLLKDNGIEAYIWMGDDLKKKAKSVLKTDRSLGILGIACIPELTAGMRNCREQALPVIGLPLDANRCMRWMGDFHENSVNLPMLEKLIK